MNNARVADLVVCAGLAAAIGGRALAMPISFDNSCGTNKWHGSCTTFVQPNHCYCSNNWNTGTVETTNCSGCAAEPGAADDVTIGNIYVEADSTAPIHSLSTTVLFRNSYIIDVSDSAVYGGPVVGWGAFAGNGSHLFLDLVTPDSGMEVRWPARATFSGGLQIEAGQGFGVYSEVHNTAVTTWASNLLAIDGAYGGGTSACFHNDAGATFAAIGDGEIRGIIGLGHFENAGTLIKNGGLGTTTVGSEFKNSGYIDVQTGSLLFTNDLTLGNEAHIGSGSIMEIRGSGAVPAFFAVTGPGVLRLSGYFGVYGLATISNLDMVPPGGFAGVRQGPGTMMIQSSAKLGGTFSEGGTTLLMAGSTGSVGGTLNMVDPGTSIENHGLLHWDSHDIQIEGDCVVKNGGVLDCAGTGTMSGFFFTIGHFENSGTFRKSAGGITNVSCQFLNSGTVEVNGGTLQVTDFHQSMGKTVLGAGILYLVDSTLDIQGGMLSGSGNIQGRVRNSGGTVAPGSSPGTIRIADGFYGNGYTQEAGGTLEIELGGTTPGSGFDQLIIGSGAPAAVNGTLRVKLINGFHPQSGMFDILTAGSVSGQFSTWDLPAGFSVIYLPDRVRLVAAGTCPGDLNGDDLVDDSDFVQFVNQYNILDCADPAMPSTCAADLNGDGIVEDSDFVIFVASYNELICP